MANEDDFPTQFLTGQSLPRSPGFRDSSPLTEVPGHLERGELLGEGGMGQVYRVHEPALKRTLALKTLRLAEKQQRLDRFVREACTTAQLQHPGIIAIHSLGELPDGRPYFTMPEIRGVELARLIESHHREGTPSLRELVRFLRRACEPLAYAHAKGVVHRDFKPENTMIGAHGEVLVVDWGLARRADEEQPEPQPSELQVESPTLTRTGGMMGTPAYMAPEQITGRELSPRSDVYAVGAVLYEVLNGHPPRVGTLPQVLNQTLTGAQPPACSGPPSLVTLVYSCLANDPGDRPEDGAAIGAALEAWLEGAQRSEEADRLVGEAVALEAMEQKLRGTADAVQAAAQALLEPLGDFASEEDKAPGWILEDEAANHRTEAERLHHRVEQVLWSAVARDDQHQPAREALARRFREDHRRGEQKRDSEAVSRSREALVAQLQYLSPRIRLSHEQYLEGQATLSLTTEPPGAEVIARPIEERRRLKVEGDPVSLGHTPIDTVNLAAGSWMLELVHPACEPVRYPVVLGRQGHWNTTPPDGADPLPIPLPPRSSVGEDFRYVPAGWFTAGGDPEVPRATAARALWCHGFVMKRDPVTNREYLVFLDDLVRRGEVELSRRYSPRDYHERLGELATPLWGQHEDGTWFLTPDPDGDEWDPDWPVMMVDMPSTAAYAAWYAERTGLPWRLPAEFEWEKAARGVDGRIYPWGDHLDLTWASVEFHEGSALTRADERPRDCSPYGLRQMGGAVAERCLEPRSTAVPDSLRVVVPELDLSQESHVSRGGSWSGPRYGIRSAARGFSATNRGFFSQGFRIVRSYG